MILQKLATAIRRQDWFQVLIEVLIVIVGIFLGLQVQAWYKEGQDRVEEHQYLLRLHDDISNSIEDNNARLSFINRQDEFTRIMLEDLGTCTLKPGNETVFTNGFFTMGKNITPILYRNVIDELNSAGKSTLIRSVGLRNAIAEHLSYLNQTLYVHEAIAKRTMPHILKVDNKITFNLTEPVVGDQDVEVGEIIYDFETLCQDKELIHSISLIKAYSYDALARLKIVIEQQQALLLLVEAELEKFK